MQRLGLDVRHARRVVLSAPMLNRLFRRIVPQVTASASCPLEFYTEDRGVCVLGLTNIYRRNCQTMGNCTVQCGAWYGVLCTNIPC
ncbi:hypothetical protein Lfu02_79520 [Longispora fulva]|uniref:Uncharacterized protein n=1 Tax=Longispora fulva TaxID=619741 RepID=A0A8J7GLX7_9ACTN|nr:hypothetical protein [Longispora fulva]GIG63580.1 hypothetical protein Lfu02_79520 [Longispora fulva]